MSPRFIHRVPRLLYLALCALLLVLTACGDELSTKIDPTAPLGDVVQTLVGPVSGTLDKGVRIFKGVPYAAPPLEDLRFAKPTAHAQWSMPLAATAFGPGCPQPASPISAPGAEDCLSLNIWAPNRMEPKPVMVWLHGGAFYLGAGGSAIYEGQHLATAGDVVVVTLNYRLGVLGFLPMMDPEYRYMTMLGLLDQQFALKWVRDNITAFGGDPNNVTIFGESAGGFSVCHHMGMPSSDGLFHRAIIQSGGGCVDPAPIESAQAASAQFWSQTQCELDDVEMRVACARDLDVETILAAQKALPKNALGLISVQPFASDAPKLEGGLSRRLSGDVTPIPVLIGSNEDEMTLFTTLGYVPVRDEADYEVALDLLGLDDDTKDAVRALYNEAAYGTLRKAVEALGTDTVFTCPAMRFARASAGLAHPVYLYQFQLHLGQGLSSIGATHGAEIPFVFDTADAGLGGIPLQLDIESEQIDRFQALWTDFARTGRPTPNLDWNPLEVNSPNVLVMAAEWAIVSNPFEERCALLPEVSF